MNATPIPTNEIGFRYTVLLTILFCVTFSISRCQSQEEAWLIRWEPNSKVLLKCVVEQTKDGGSTFKLAVHNAAGKVLFTMHGEAFLGAVGYSTSLDRDEELLLTHWSFGNGYKLVVLQASDSGVRIVGEMDFDAEDYALYDLDGDGVSEIITVVLKYTENKPVSQWPLSTIVYKWTGAKFVTMGEIPNDSLRACINGKLSKPKS